MKPPTPSFFLSVLQVVAGRCMFRRFSDSKDSRDYNMAYKLKSWLKS